MKNHRIYAYFLFFLALTKDCYIVLSDPIPSSGNSVAEGVANAAAAAVSSSHPPDDDRLNLLAFVNPCAIAAAVFGVPAAPYVIPCTILRRIRILRETLMPNAPPVSPLMAGMLSERQKLLIGNLILSQASRR